MHNLGESLGTYATGPAKIAEVLRINKEDGFYAIRDLINKALTVCANNIRK
jgi:hypothetical protein